MVGSDNFFSAIDSESKVALKMAFAFGLKYIVIEWDAINITSGIANPTLSPWFI